MSEPNLPRTLTRRMNEGYERHGGNLNEIDREGDLIDDASKRLYSFYKNVFLLHPTPTEYMKRIVDDLSKDKEWRNDSLRLRILKQFIKYGDYLEPVGFKSKFPIQSLIYDKMEENQRPNNKHAVDSETVLHNIDDSIFDVIEYHIDNETITELRNEKYMELLYPILKAEACIEEIEAAVSGKMEKYSNDSKEKLKKAYEEKREELQDDLESNDSKKFSDLKNEYNPEDKKKIREIKKAIEDLQIQLDQAEQEKERIIQEYKKQPIGKRRHSKRIEEIKHQVSGIKGEIVEKRKELEKIRKEYTNCVTKRMKRDPDGFCLFILKNNKFEPVPPEMIRNRIVRYLSGRINEYNKRTDNTPRKIKSNGIFAGFELSEDGKSRFFKALWDGSLTAYNKARTEPIMITEGKHDPDENPDPEADPDPEENPEPETDSDPEEEKDPKGEEVIQYFCQSLKSIYNNLEGIIKDFEIEEKRDQIKNLVSTLTENSGWSVPEHIERSYLNEQLNNNRETCKIDGKYGLLKVADDLAKGNFRTNEQTKRCLYYFAVVYEMTFSMTEKDPIRDMEKRLFTDYYNDNLMRMIMPAYNERNANKTLETTPSGRGINYNSFAEMVFLYFISGKGGEYEPCDKLRHAQGMIDNINKEISTREGQYANNENSRTRYARENAETLFSMEPEEFEKALVHNNSMIINTNKKPRNPFEYKNEQLTAVKYFIELEDKYQAVLKKQNSNQDPVIYYDLLDEEPDERIWFESEEGLNDSITEMCESYFLSPEEANEFKSFFEESLKKIDDIRKDREDQYKNKKEKTVEKYWSDRIGIISRTALIVLYYDYKAAILKYRMEKETIDIDDIEKEMEQMINGLNEELQKCLYPEWNPKNMLDIFIAFLYHEQLAYYA